MTFRIHFLALALLALVGIPLSTGAAPRPPNIILFLADDLGYGDVGVYGQKQFRTPNLDRLAAEGMRFTQHYAGNAVCAPSRCVLLTGKHPGHAFIRNNRELKTEGQVPLPPETITLAKVLQKNGYATGAFGKWGLGGPATSGDPLQQGFDRFFGYNCQRVAHNYYPTSLWDNARRQPLNNPPFAAHQKLSADADAQKPETYEQFTGKDYAPDLICEQALKFIRNHSGKPFFLYFPTTVPHLALQVPPDSLAEYKGKFPEEPYRGGKSYLPHRTPRAAYAAMVTRMDRDLGRIINAVKELGLDQNTIFIFSSDNGPLYDRLGGTDTDFFQSAGDFRGRKGSLYEGGVRVPCLIRWKGRISGGKIENRVTGFEDWLPTLLELAGLKKEIPREIDGISFAPTLLGKKQKPRPFLYREFPAYGGQQSVRVGDWKLVKQGLNSQGQNPQAKKTTEIFNLAQDPNESEDLSGRNAQMVATLEKILQEQHVASKEFPFRALDEKSTKEQR